MTVYLCDYVRTTKYGYEGRVTAIHHECPEGAAWRMGQEIPITPKELNERWVSVLQNNGSNRAGAVVVPESDCTVVEPFEFGNLWADYYFRDAVAS